jgi:hypothetical protein
MTAKAEQALKSVGNLIWSAMNTFETRAKVEDIDALSDIECDLMSALVTVKAIILEQMRGDMVAARQKVEARR